MDFSKFDKMVDIEGLKNDVKGYEKNSRSGDFVKVPHGKYEVAVNKLELTESKTNKPMVKGAFEVISEGEFKGGRIFMNQLVDEGFKIHIVNELLRAMLEKCDNAPFIEFETYHQYGDLLMDVHECIDGNFEYLLNYIPNPKNPNFDKFEIEEVYVMED